MLFSWNMMFLIHSSLALSDSLVYVNVSYNCLRHSDFTSTVSALGAPYACRWRSLHVSFFAFAPPPPSLPPSQLDQLMSPSWWLALTIALQTAYMEVSDLYVYLDLPVEGKFGKPSDTHWGKFLTRNSLFCTELPGVFFFCKKGFIMCLPSEVVEFCKSFPFVVPVPFRNKFCT